MNSQRITGRRFAGTTTTEKHGMGKLPILIMIVISLASRLGAAERNVALASDGGYVVVDSSSTFGRNDGTYGGFDFECGPQQLNNGRYVTDPTLRLPHGNRWISQLDRKHPHWAWIGFAGPRGSVAWSFVAPAWRIIQPISAGDTARIMA